MKWTLVRYRAKPDQADENQRPSAAVFSELQQKAPAGLRYAVFRLPDDTFVHLATLEDGATALSALETFRAFESVSGSAAPSPPLAAQPILARQLWNAGGRHGQLMDCTTQHDIVSREEWPAARTLLG